LNDSTHNAVHALHRRWRELSLSGLLALVPPFSSLLLRFDPLLLPADALLEAIRPSLSGAHAPVQRAPFTHTISVAYGGDFGPDLKAIAAMHNTTESEVANLHSSRTYRVYFLGFMPGFAYMGKVDDRIASPRHASPRVRV